VLTISQTGIPGITCGRCGNPVSLEEAVVLKHGNTSAVVFTCIDCAEELGKKHQKYTFIPARTFFESLTTGKPRRVLQIGT